MKTIASKPERLTRIAYFIAYAFLPVFAFFSGGTAATFLAIATLLLLVEALRKGTLAPCLRMMAGGALSRPPVLLALIFVALGWLSLGWSPWPAETIRFSTHLTGMLLVALLWWHLSSPADMSWMETMMRIGIVVTAIVLLLAFYDVIDLRAVLKGDQRASPFNRSTLITGLFAATGVALAIARQRPSYSAWALFALGAFTVFSSSSETAMLFTVSFLLLLAFFAVAIRIADWLPVLVPPFLFFVFPLMVAPLRIPLEAAMDTSLRHVLISSSAPARQEIWASFLNAAMQHPILGWGLGTERYVPLAGQVMYADGRGPWTHPHSLPVQVLVNLGVTGFVIFGGAVLAASLAIYRLPRPSRVPAFALLTSLLVAGFVSHGAWQTWWLAAVVLTMAPLFVQARGLGSAGIQTQLSEREKLHRS